MTRIWKRGAARGGLPTPTHPYLPPPPPPRARPERGSCGNRSWVDLGPHVPSSRRVGPDRPRTVRAQLVANDVASSRASLGHTVSSAVRCPRRRVSSAARSLTGPVGGNCMGSGPAVVLISRAPGGNGRGSLVALCVGPWGRAATGLWVVQCRSARYLAVTELRKKGCGHRDKSLGSEPPQVAHPFEIHQITSRAAAAYTGLPAHCESGVAVC